MKFYQLDVFGSGPYSGNPLAVFPGADHLDAAQMQMIASEMNLSETTFVTRASVDSYDMRIFTPAEELSFAGHPTIGTAFCLAHLGRVTGEHLTQRTSVGQTKVTHRNDRWWFERPGRSHDDLESSDEKAGGTLAEALSLDPAEIGLEARELGRSGRLGPAVADVGMGHLMIPVRDLRSLAACSVRADLLAPVSSVGAYCFTAAGAGRIRARGFFPGVGISEDPATGSAAAELGIYLAARIGDIDFEISQGREIGRPSRLWVQAKKASVMVGGRCDLVLEGELVKLPPSRTPE
ncbi:MAG: PhzF family phenazine biosynthesis protein [Actinomycetota bacterium]|nr:PhzF family phenazine biosynthesis protein [Actinomycetota bacterium]MDQ3218967.1 PhzF family phenazine biosynthesis protein [Actinomycetota bacterium]